MYSNYIGGNRRLSSSDRAMSERIHRPAGTKLMRRFVKRARGEALAYRKDVQRVIESYDPKTKTFVSLFDYSNPKHKSIGCVVQTGITPKPPRKK